MYDMVFICSEKKGPCEIGQIIEIQEIVARGDEDPFKVKVQLYKYYLDLQDAKDNIAEDMHFQVRMPLLFNNIVWTNIMAIFRIVIST